MSTQEPELPYGTTGERLRAFAVNEQTRERVNTLVARYWEVAAYGVLLLSAIVLRFYNLGSRAMHHDESLHGFYSWGFTEGVKDFFTFQTANNQGWDHVPFMHGPFQFIASGFLMWIFGDGDYQARLLAAILGTALVGMPWLLRKQLGTIGALVVATLICFSPTLIYYSRFTREDIYTAFWTFGLAIFVWRYVVSREDKFLFLSAGFMAGLFLTKETSFMTVGSFLFFLDYLFARHIADRVGTTRPEMTSLQHVGLSIALIPVAWILAFAWPFTADRRAKYGLDEDSPAEANLIVVLGTLALPMFAAAVQFLPFGAHGAGSTECAGLTWRNCAGESNNYHVADPEFAVAVSSVLVLIGISAALGLLWRPRTWAIAAACFWIPLFLLSTTFFSNMQGFFSVIWGSLDYWMSQQDVRRGNQPDYYYFITIPVYEFLPLVLSIAAMAYYAIRGRLVNALIVGGMVVAIFALLMTGPSLDGGILKCHGESCPDDAKNGVSILHIILPFTIVLIGVLSFPMDRFTRFLMFWLVVTSFALTVAGEKMPWLNVHIALPLTVLAGRFVGDILDRTDLRADLPKLERLAPFAYAAVASALAILVFVIVGPWSLASFGGWLLAAVAAVAVFWAYTAYSPRTALQVAVVGAIAAFSVFSLRAGVLASWGHPDNPYVAAHDNVLATRDFGEVPTELLVYTQTSGDVPVLRDRIAKAARESNLGKQIPLVVDPEHAWPFQWYLRDYKAVTWLGVQAGYTPPAGTAPIILAQAQVANQLNLATEYNEGESFHLRRWFPEEYRGDDGKYSARDFFRDALSVNSLGNWFDFWIRRTPPDDGIIGSVDGIAYFPKEYGEISQAPIGPTVRTEGTQLVIGGSGVRQGQLSAPADVAFDSSGNIYVADSKNNRISKYDAQGNFQTTLGGFGTDVTFTEPWSVVVASDGSVFVANTWGHTIAKMDSSGALVKSWGEPCTTVPNCDEFHFFGPREITLTAEGNVMVVDTGNSRVLEYTSDGDFVRQFGTKGESGGPLEFNEPVGLVTAPNGDIYVADYWNKRVVHLGNDLQSKGQIAVDSWGSTNVTDRPYMALLADGRLLVTDPANAKVLVFAADGSPSPAFDVPRETDAPGVRPIGVASDGTSVIVADGAGNVVRKVPLTEVAP